MSVEWEAAICHACGWATNRMLRSKALKRVCPHCGKKALGPR